jgi:parallel beta helix pectate lyase-like protein
MRRFIALPLTITALAVSLAFIASPAHAQTSRSWVSGTGDDSNPCSRTSPCKTFAGAMAQTLINGQINCLDPGGFSSVTITKSMTIDCHEAPAAILVDVGTNGIVVDFDSFDPSDTRKTVIIRNVNIQGFSTGGVGINLMGSGAGSLVHIEDCVVEGNTGGIGISDNRDRGALVINNTTVRDMGEVGIVVVSTHGGSRRAMISNTRVVNATNGIFVGNDANVVLSHSIVSNNSVAGLSVLVANGVIIVDSTTIAHNGIGIQNSGTAEVSNSDITFNTTAVQGSINSFSNNRFTKNTALGGTIVPIGTTSNPSGQQ